MEVNDLEMKVEKAADLVKELDKEKLKKIKKIAEILKEE